MNQNGSLFERATKESEKIKNNETTLTLNLNTNKSICLTIEEAKEVKDKLNSFLKN